VANSDVVASVSETLQLRLTRALSGLGTPAPFAELHDLATMPPSDPPRVTLFLYDIVEDPTVRNRAKTTEQVGVDLQVRKQPLGLALHYMVTAWGGDRASEQRMLGRVLQVMYDDAVIDGLELVGALAGTPAGLRVTLSPMHLDDRARVWWAIGQPYRLSLNYQIRVVDVDPLAATAAAPVRSRSLATGVLP
jgi:hypothetical protein